MTAAQCGHFSPYQPLTLQPLKGKSHDSHGIQISQPVIFQENNPLTDLTFLTH